MGTTIVVICLQEMGAASAANCRCTKTPQYLQQQICRQQGNVTRSFPGDKLEFALQVPRCLGKTVLGWHVQGVPKPRVHLMATVDAAVQQPYPRHCLCALHERSTDPAKHVMWSQLGHSASRSGGGGDWQES